MLDEIKEYEEYTNSDLVLSKDSRLKAETIKDGCTGVYRAYEIIARRFFFDERLLHKALSDRIYCTKQALLSWNGFSYCKDCKDCNACSLKNEYEAFFALLPRRILSLFKDEKISVDDARTIDGYKKILESGKEIEGELAKINIINTDSKPKPYSVFCSQYNKEKFLHSDFPKLKTIDDENYDNSITADKVIANAVSKGALKVSYLVCSGDLPKINKSSRDKVLKLMAACLLNQTQGETSVYINKSDVVNWFFEGRIHGNTTIPNYFITDNSHGIKNMAKVIPNDDIKDIGFFIVEEKDIKDYQNSDYTIFKDNGRRAKIES